MPTGMAYEDAAALPQAGGIALQGIRDKRRVQPGQKVLINGGGRGYDLILDLAAYRRPASPRGHVGVHWEWAAGKGPWIWRPSGWGLTGDLAGRKVGSVRATSCVRPTGPAVG
jgi:hypothetical protein